MSMTISEIMKKMIAFCNGNTRDINHLMKVWTYAKTIGELENLDEETLFTLEVTAILHDIALDVCREKYGSIDGKYQEPEGEILGAEFLKGSGLPQEMIERVCYLIGHHHTLTEINGMDYQILIEADYLVNADESKFPIEDIKNFRETIFRTASGTEILNSIFFR